MSNIHAFQYNLLGIDGNVCVYMSNMDLLHFRQILYHLSHQGSPYMLIPVCIYRHTYNEKLYIKRIINNI